MILMGTLQMQLCKLLVSTELHDALKILEANGKQHGMGVVTTSKARANQHGSFGPIGMISGRVDVYVLTTIHF